MSKRILIIGHCIDCPNYTYTEEWYPLCKLTDLKIEDCYNIPDECPLPKMEKNKND